jgi:hypothetical protein
MRFDGRVGGLAQVKARGLAKVRALFVFAVAAYTIVGLPKLLTPTRMAWRSRDLRGRRLAGRMQPKREFRDSKC